MIHFVTRFASTPKPPPMGSARSACFDQATPQERLCWQMAAIAGERLRQTDIAGVAGE
jgi:hypothetical protein